MVSDILVGTAAIVLADVLLWIGLPNKDGITPRFLRFESLRWSIRPSSLRFLQLESPT